MEYNVFIEINGIQEFFVNCKNWTHAKGEQLMRLINGLEYNSLACDVQAGVFNCTSKNAAIILNNHLRADIQYV